MDDIIRQLWRGELCPDAKRLPKGSAAEHLLADSMERHQALLEKIDESLCEELDQLIEAKTATNGAALEQAFVDGFRLATQLIIQAMSARESSE